ncbi:MAG: four-carbon acid sugar kinase family protein [Anaerolineae bacterium]
MTARGDMLPLTVLADDLTGAMDSGLQFASRGLETVVQLSRESSARSPVTAISSESRDLSPTAAIGRVRAIVPRLQEGRVLKKIDSTLRGNVGFELRALLSDLELRAVVVAPAFPQGGRTLLSGQLLVDGRPLAITAFRSDPRWPMIESYLPTYLMQQSGLEVSHIALDTVERGAEAIAGALSACRARLVVTDATSDAHLTSIATAVRELGPEWMPCGSAGLALAWASLIQAGTPPSVTFPDRGARGILFVVGSRNPVTLAQLEQFAKEGAARATLDSRGTFEPRIEIDRLAGAIFKALDAGRDAILDATSSALIPGAGSRVADILARVVSRSVHGGLVGGLFLTGGEVALSVCQELSVQAIRILEAIEPGIPGGQLIGGPASGLPAVTKAGGFGSEGALAAASKWLHNAVVASRPGAA